MSTFFDVDAAAARNNRMWKRLGGLLERLSYKAAEDGRPREAASTARLAEACFWQATGEGDVHGFKDLLPKDVQ